MIMERFIWAVFLEINFNISHRLFTISTIEATHDRLLYIVKSSCGRPKEEEGPWPEHEVEHCTNNHLWPRIPSALCPRQCRATRHQKLFHTIYFTFIPAHHTFYSQLDFHPLSPQFSLVDSKFELFMSTLI